MLTTFLAARFLLQDLRHDNTIINIITKLAKIANMTTASTLPAFYLEYNLLRSDM